MRDLTKWFLPLLAVAFIASGCNPYKKMASGVDQIGFTTSPEVLTLDSGKVIVDLSVNFPPNYFDRNSVLQVTPVLTYEGGEIVFDPIEVQGGAIVGNRRSVNFGTGGVITEKLVFDYKPALRRSTLNVRVAVCNGKHFVPVNPKTGALISNGELDLVVNEPKSSEALAIVAECDIVVAEGISTLINMIDYKRMMIEIDENIVAADAALTIFEKGYTASQVSAEDHKAAQDLNNEGVKLVKAGKLKEAVEKFEASMAKGVYVDFTNRNLFLTYLAMDKKKDAMAVYDIVDPVQRGVVYLLNKDYAQALALIEEAHALAILKLVCDDVNGALKALGKDKSSRGEYLRAIILTRLGQREQAMKSYNEAIKVKGLKEQSKTDVNILVLVEK
ncbi:MAG: tetratricopeptide repeat protein [Rikenellaceae bacterium]